jgi:putative hydrolase
MFKPKFKIQADLHTHTIGSGHAYSTIEEMAGSARRKGIKILGMTDHGPNMPGGAHEYYFHNLRIIPEYLRGVRILRGIEANIINKSGQLDMDSSFLASYEVVIASAHIIASPKLSKKAATNMHIKMMENPHVDILGHIENPQFEVDYPKLIGAAKESRKLIEINNASFTIARHGSFKNCLEIIRLLKEENMLTVINSDAHIAARVGFVDRALEVALEQGIKPENILNLDYRRTAEYLKVKL